MKRMLLLIFMFSVCGFMAGCGANSVNSAVPAKSYTAEISPKPAGIEYGATGTLTVTVKDESGQIVQNFSVQWLFDNNKPFGTFSNPNAASTVLTAMSDPNAVIRMGITPQPPDQYSISAICSIPKDNSSDEYHCSSIPLVFKGGNITTGDGPNDVAPDALVWRAGAVN